MNLAILSKVDLNAKILESLIALFRSSNFVSREEFHIFTTDSIKLSHVFSNLISNAIKHNSSANKKLVISSQRKDEFYEFTVADNGPGIAPKDYEKVFQMF